MQLQLQGGSTDLDLLAASARSLIEAARSQSGIGAVNTSFRADVPQIFVDVDRNQAESLGVPIGNVFSTLQSYTGLELRQPVQPVQPELSDLRPGRQPRSG